MILTVVKRLKALYHYRMAKPYDALKEKKITFYVLQKSNYKIENHHIILSHIFPTNRL